MGALDLRPPDLIDILDNVTKRIYDLEQRFTTPSVVKAAVGNQFDTIVLGPTGNQTTLQKPVSPPTSLVLASNSYFDLIYINASWTAPGDASATEYQVEWAKKLGPSSYDIPSTMRTSGASARIQPLEPNTTYGVRVYSVNQVGQYSTPLPSSGYTDVTTVTDSSIPHQITGVAIARGATTAVVTFTAADPLLDPDVANGHGVYRVQLSTSNTFTTIDRQTDTNAVVVAFNDITAQGSYYARVAAIDSSGNIGPWSAVAGPATVGGVNDAMIIADLSAAKITAGFLDANRIQTNSLVAEKLQTSQLQTVDLTLAGGSIKAGNPGTGGGQTGLLINSQGMRLYNNGVLTVTIDAVTGSATFTGTVTGSTITGSTITGGVIQTASSGRRIVLDSSSDIGTIHFYTGLVGEVTPGTIVSASSSVQRLTINGPDFGGGKSFLVLSTGALVYAVDLQSVNAMRLKAASGIDIQPTSGGTTVLGNLTVNLGTLDVSGGNLTVNGQVTLQDYIIAYKAANGDFGTFPVRASNKSGNPNCGYAIHNESYAVAGIIKQYGPNGNPIEFRNSADSGYCEIKASAFTVNSRREFKRDIRQVKTSDLWDRASRVRPVLYKYHEPPCGACAGRGHIEVQEEGWVPLYHAHAAEIHLEQLGLPAEPGSYDCIKCGGDGVSKHPVELANSNQEQFGFLVEELQHHFPELIQWEADERGGLQPGGLVVNSLAGLLFALVQQLREEVVEMRRKAS